VLCFNPLVSNQRKKIAIPKHVSVSINNLLRADIKTDPNQLTRDNLTTYSTICRRRSKVKVKTAISKPFLRAKIGRPSLITPNIEYFVKLLYKKDPG
jgi:hypothetical protein